MTPPDLKNNETAFYTGILGGSLTLIAIILGVVSLMLSIYPNIDGEDPKERFLTLIWITTAGGCLSAISAALCLVGMWGVRIPRWLIVLPIGMVVVLALIGLPMFVYRTLRLL